MQSLELYCTICGAKNDAKSERCFACKNSLKVTTPLQDENREDTQSPTPPTAQLLRGRYRIIHKVGEGGFSAVFKAQDEHTQRVVAIKAISLQGLSTQEKIEATDAFNREVNMLSKLDHRNLPHLYEHFSDTESWYMVMDFIEGSTLEHRMERRKGTEMHFDEILDIGLVLSNVLEYLHRLQPPVIFRDLKPTNIMQTRSGHLFLIDFGIARHFRPGQARDTIPFGSPGYAAPEQYGKAQTTPRSDVYSLGVILHYLLTGEDPSLNPFHFSVPRTQQPEKQALIQLILSMTSLNVEERPDTGTVKRELQTIATMRSQQQGAYYAAQPQPHPSFHAPPAPPPPFAAPGAGQVMAAQVQGQTFYMPPHIRYSYTQKAKLTAMWSIIFLIASLFEPFLFSAFIVWQIARHVPSYTLLGNNAIIPLLLILVPPILAIIFGHKGRRDAQIAGTKQDVATVGMIFGYILATLYVLVLLCGIIALPSTW